MSGAVSGSPVELPPLPPPHSPSEGPTLATRRARQSLWLSIPGPVFAKELWTTGRRAGVSWTRMVYLLILLGVVSLVFLSTSAGSGNATSEAVTSVAALQQYQQVAPSISIAVLWCQFIMLTLLGGTMGASAISEERRTGTLATLLTTPLKSWQIVLGKLLGRSVELLILTLLSVPLLLGLRVYGGASALAILVGTLICVVSTLFATQLGIFFSVRSKRSVAPMAGVILTLVILWGGVPLAIALVSSLTGFAGGRVWGMEFAMGLFCLPMSLGDVTSRLMGFGGMGRGVVFWPWSVALHVVLTALLFFVSSIMLRRVMLREASGPAPARVKGKRASLPAAQGALASPHPPTTNTTTTPTPIAGLGSAAPAVASTVQTRTDSAVEPAARTSRVVGDEPVRWRESQARLVQRRWMRWVAGVLGGLLALFIYYMSELEGVQMALTVIGVLVAMFAGALAAPGAISQEREGRTLEVLLATPLSAWEIVWGKYVGAVRKLMIIPLLVVLHLVLSGPLAPLVAMGLRWFDPFFWNEARLWRIDEVHWIAIPMVFLVMMGPVLFLPGLGVLFSSLTKRSTAAAVLTLSTGLMLWGGMLMVVGLLGAVFDRAGGGGGGSSLSDLAGDLILGINPVALAVVGVDGASHGSPWSGEHFDMPTFGSSSPNAGAGGFLVVVVVVCGLYLLAGLVCLKLAAMRLAGPTWRRK
jgi:ABC-type transport system involved in multi-copper enzyme maturation permease subunit